MSDHNFDLIVIGGGIAGLTAATTAAESGLKTLLVEKQPNYGGSSAMSGGWFAFSETPEQKERGIEDSTELFRRDVMEVGGHLSDPALVDAYLGHQHEVYRWLKDHGTPFREVAISSGMSAARGHLSDGTKNILDRLFAYFTEAGGEVRFNAPARRLIMAEDQVVGVEIEVGESVDKLFATHGVVLASGGFSRSTDMFQRFAPEQLAAIPYGGRGNTGDGLKMAWKLGAGFTDMSFVSATYGSHPDTSEEAHELLTAYYKGAIIVNQLGKRFVDESMDYKHLGSEVLKQPEGLGFQIFDADLRAKSQPGVPLADMDFIEDKGHMFKADTLAELAEIAGIDVPALQETVDNYNSAVRGEREDDVSRANLCNGQGELIEILRAPFYAYPAKSLMTSTYCGLTISPKGEVLDIFGDEIKGLYAIGEVTGGFHGAAYMTGTSLGKGAVFGHLVAQNIAAHVVATI